MKAWDPSYFKIYQTDAAFAEHPEIRHGACFFMSIVGAVSFQFDMPFTHESVMDFYLHELGDDDVDVDNELFVGDVQNLINDLVGADRVLYRGWKPADYTPMVDEIVWAPWHRDGTSFIHFVLMDGNSVLYDPWHKDGSASVRAGRRTGSRVARIL